MDINTLNATKYFFPSTSLEYVYYEAIANALDANATKIEISVNIESFDKPETLSISIKDNGVGFNDENFRKFNTLLETKDQIHKGIGRLVFITYFSNISISSNFDLGYREFVFSESYDYKKVKVDERNGDNGTELIFNGYQKNTIKAYDYISVAGIKSKLLSHFYPRFYELKKSNIEFEILIRVNTKVENFEKQFFNGETVLNNTDIKDLKQKEFNMPSYLFDKYKLSYSIERDYDLLKSSVTIALCADGRTLPYDVFSEKDFPPNYKMIFLLESDAFSGRTEPNRESLILDEIEKRRLKKDFATIMQKIMLEEIPDLKERNNVTRDAIRKCYPHLEGFFDEDDIGFLDRYAVVQNAQEKFFASQRKILEADNLTESQYNESLNQASRVLTEYILYRTKIINKLKSITPNDKEAAIHNVLAPKGKQFDGIARTSDIYQNNLWILDDKFMSYLKVLSDFEIEEIYREINVEGSHHFKEKEDGRPDITILFSGEPEKTEKIDVVIVELKRLGLNLARKEELVSQIRQRARRLMEFYPDKIQRIWFYGIIDFDKEFRVSLMESGYKKLFSFGEIFYNRDKVVINQDTEEIKDIDVFIMEYKTVLEDAEKRNSVFLDLLKESIKKKC